MQLNLFCKGDILQRVGREACPIKIGQILDHRFGLFGLSDHDEAGKRIQRIEQEMRIDLIAQGTQLGILGRLGKAGHFALGFAHFTGVANGDVECAPSDQEKIMRNRNIGNLLPK